MNITKSNYDYCEISKRQDEYIVKFGYQSYHGKTIFPPIMIGDRTFSSEKKALRYAKKIAPPACIKINKDKYGT